MSGDFYERAAQALPNFPRAVIDLWFEHAVRQGQDWPPPLDRHGIPVGVWGGILGDRQFAFWRTVTWARERLSITQALLEPTSGDIAGRIVAAFDLGLPGGIPGVTTRNYRERVEGFRTMLSQTRALPHPPLLLRVGRWFEVLDGFHRLAALFLEQQNGFPLDSSHEAWIAAGTTP